MFDCLKHGKGANILSVTVFSRSIYSLESSEKMLSYKVK